MLMGRGILLFSQKLTVKEASTTLLRTFVVEILKGEASFILCYTLIYIQLYIWTKKNSIFFSDTYFDPDF